MSMVLKDPSIISKFFIFKICDFLRNIVVGIDHLRFIQKVQFEELKLPCTVFLYFVPPDDGHFQLNHVVININL